MSDSIVVVGGGHAGVQLCAALAEAGLGRRVQLVCAEPELPYQRPPLSKAYLKSADEGLQLHRAESWFADAGITLHRAVAASAVDRGARTLTLASGALLPYGWLVLATGARARRLTTLPPSPSNVHTLRSAADAARLRAQLAAASRVAVLGGGFIGLEIAATARAQGKAVTVLEAMPRLLSRSLSAEVAEHVLASHRAAGTDVRLGAKVEGFDVEGERVVACRVNGERLALDLLVLGIGAEPEDTLARACGLACDNGIVVDACLRTSDPAILAIGDCTNFPEAGSGRPLRLESVQNANDQARTAAATLQGREQPYAALPWFWSDQGPLRLQMAGLVPAEGERHRRPGAKPESFSVLHYAGGRLRCVESVNAPLDHMAARKLLEAGRSPPPEAACDPAQPLKSFV